MRLPYPDQLRCDLPLSRQHEQFVHQSRTTAREIIEGKDGRFAIIVGPCSVHDRDSTLEYAARLKKLSAEIQDTCFIVMRAYLEKSRTSVGWKGYIYDPDLSGKNALGRGIYLSRELLLDLTEMGIPLATEFVDPLLSPYFSDLVSWGFIGARTSTSQPHRQLASSLSFPIGCKNDLSGDIRSALETVISTRHPHMFIDISEKGMISHTSDGNPYTHIVLRGGRNQSNYEEDALSYCYSQLKKHHLPARVLIDCAHGNSQKQPLKQSEVAKYALEMTLKGDKNLVGIMLESHLHFGSQKPSSGVSYGISVTDPCLDWSSTEDLLLSIHSSFSKSFSSGEVPSKEFSFAP